MARQPLRETGPVVDGILRGEYDDLLDYIDQAVRSRKKRLFRPGSRVRLTGTRNPEFEGKVGTVVKVNAKRITVGLGTRGEWGYDEGELLVPASMLVAATEEA